MDSSTGNDPSDHQCDASRGCMMEYNGGALPLSAHRRHCRSSTAAASYLIESPVRLNRKETRKRALSEARPVTGKERKKKGERRACERCSQPARLLLRLDGSHRRAVRPSAAAMVDAQRDPGPLTLEHMMSRKSSHLRWLCYSMKLLYHKRCMNTWLACWSKRAWNASTWFPVMTEETWSAET